MSLIFSFTNPETEEQRIIRHADIIVANSSYTGELDNDCLDVIGLLTKPELPPALNAIRDELRKKQPPNVNNSGTINIEITKQFIQNNYDIVRDHLLNNGYINTPDHTRKWILNERGKLMKELGGHKKYVKHRRREIDILKNQNLINWVLIIATVLAAIMPWIIELTKTSKPTKMDVRIDSVWLHQQLKPGMPQKERPSDTTTLSKQQIDKRPTQKS